MPEPDLADPSRTSLRFYLFLGVISVRLVVAGILLILLAQAVEFRKHSLRFFAFAHFPVYAAELIVR